MAYLFKRYRFVAIKVIAWRGRALSGQQNEFSDDDFMVLYFPSQRQDASCTYPFTLKRDFRETFLSAHVPPPKGKSRHWLIEVLKGGCTRLDLKSHFFFETLKSKRFPLRKTIATLFYINMALCRCVNKKCLSSEVVMSPFVIRFICHVSFAPHAPAHIIQRRPMQMQMQCKPPRLPRAFQFKHIAH